MRARVAAASTARGTFRSSRAASNIDFFIISERLGMAVEKVELQEGTGIKSHVPVQLIFKDKPVSLHTLMLKKRACLPLERLHGPLSPELDWSHVEAAAEAALAAARTSQDKKVVQQELDRAYDAWASLAVEDIARVTGAEIKPSDIRGKPPVFKWRPILPEHKPRSRGEAKASVLTWLRSAAAEARRILDTIDDDDNARYDSPHVTPSLGGNLPYGGTFAAPVRGGYTDSPQPLPDHGAVGARSARRKRT